MTQKWISTKYTGVRYREHPQNMHNRKPDRYFAIRYKINGKLKEEALGWASDGWSAEKAKNERAKLRIAHQKGEGPQTLAEKRQLENDERQRKEAARKLKAKEQISFSNYFDDNYFPEAQSNKTKDSWRREKNLFTIWIDPAIGRMPFKDIRPFHLERIKKNMNDAGRAPRSIQYALAVVRQVFNHAIRNEMFSGDNPATKVKKPKVDNKRVRFLNQTEADSLLVELKGRSLQLHDMALISLHCGLRAGELFDLTWGCVDLDRESLVLMDTKGVFNRTLYMTSEVKDVLSQMDTGRPTDLVFPDRNGNRTNKVSNAFGRAVAELGFNTGIEDRRHKVIFHTMRHTFASWLVQNGVDLYTVQKLMGHSTISMTERYAHLAPNNLKSAVKTLEDSINRERSNNENAEVIDINYSI